ncbi:MAG: GNAT family N-acetyltransferase [Faecalibacterium sp.]
MYIRHAVMEDLDVLAALEAVSYPPAEGASRESIRGRLAVYPDCFWLLEEQGRVCAFVNGFVTDQPDLLDVMYEDPVMHHPDGAWQMIFSVVTAPEVRGRGCASALLRRVLEDARAAGRKGVVLTCKEKLLPFYTRFGFVDEGVSGSAHGGVVWHQMRCTF